MKALHLSCFASLSAEDYDELNPNVVSLKSRERKSGQIPSHAELILKTSVAENVFFWIPRLKVAMENGVRLRSGTGGEPMRRTSRGSRDALPVRTASKEKDP